MSKLARRRKAVNYETNVPRCESCVFMRRNRTVLRDSLPIRVLHVCQRNEFEVAPNAVCDKWRSKDGREDLEALPAPFLVPNVRGAAS